MTAAKVMIPSHQRRHLRRLLRLRHRAWGRHHHQLFQWRRPDRPHRAQPVGIQPGDRTGGDERRQDRPPGPRRRNNLPPGLQPRRPRLVGLHLLKRKLLRGPPFAPSSVPSLESRSLLRQGPRFVIVAPHLVRAASDGVVRLRALSSFRRSARLPSTRTLRMDNTLTFLVADSALKR